MRKLFSVLALMALTGCGLIHQGTYEGSPTAPAVKGPRPSIFTQEVSVELTNNCAEVLKVMDGDLVRLVLRGGGTHYFKVQRPRLSDNGYASELHVTIKAYAMVKGVESYLGSATGFWSVDTWHSGYRVPWQFDRLQSPSGAKCRMKASP